MEYDLTNAIKEVIEECKRHGKGYIKRKDENGYVTLWLEAEWVNHWNGKDKIIEIMFCYSDTGNVAYSRYIDETITKK